MNYVSKHIGRAPFKTIETLCPKCNYTEDRTIDQRGKTDEEVANYLNLEIACPNCEEANMERAYLTAPSLGKFTDENSPRTFEARKKSFKQRFMKKEADDLRQKHGVNFDDALRSGAAQQIKKDLDK